MAIGNREEVGGIGFRDTGAEGDLNIDETHWHKY
jgi:hypothetical protein